MRRFQIIPFLILLLLLSFKVFSQKAYVKGKITDSRTGESIPGVSISSGNKYAVMTDKDGFYSIQLGPGKYTMKITFIGYMPENRTITLNDNETKFLNVMLSEQVKNLDLVVISGSAYAKNLNEETVSMDVIKPYIIENTNVKSIDEALQKVPGIKILDGQASIRGGSSYSYGTGSRVQVVVDGQSYLSPDLGDVRWKFVPVDNIEQVEVIKGSSSVLYGSSSMNGVVNIITGWPKNEPSTEILTYQGIYMNPSRSELNWWKKEVDGIYVPNVTGATILHKEKFGNFDLVIGGRFNMSHGYIKTIDENRAGLDFKTRFRHPKIKLTFGINGNVSYEQNTRFLFYKNSGDGGYLPLEGTGSYDNYYLISIVPNMTYYTSNGNRHKLTGMYFNVTNIEPKSHTSKPAQMVNLEYQYQQRFGKTIVCTSGLNASLGWMSNYDLYKGISPKTLFGSAFSQFEKKLGRLTFQMGLRYEMYGILGAKNADQAVYANLDKSTMETSSGPVYRAGLNFQITPTSFIRASYGQAYRFPTVSEKFMNISVSQITVLPNPDLNSEKGWSTEIGLKKEFKTRRTYSYVDLAFFWMEFRDFITYSLGSYAVTGKPDPVIGFKPFNIKKARISGYEITFYSEGKIGGFNTKFYGGYTYTYPIDLDAGKDQQSFTKYMNSFFKSIVNLDSSRKQALLYYRNRHVLKFDIETSYKKLGIGFSMDYNTNFEKIESFFAVFNMISPGIGNYMNDYPGGTLLFDGRLMFALNQNSKIVLIVKNITNKEYSERPGLIGPPRSIILQFKYQF